MYLTREDKLTRELITINVSISLKDLLNGIEKFDAGERSENLFPTLSDEEKRFIFIGIITNAWS